MAIQGAGFFQVLMPDGTTSYTRDGSFQQNNQGQLVTSSGYPVQPAITVPVQCNQPDHRQRWHGHGHTARLIHPGDDRHHTTGHVYQSDRIAKPRAKLVSGNCFIGHTYCYYTGYQCCWNVESGLCGSLQCECGGGNGEHDTDAASL